MRKLILGVVLAVAALSLSQEAFATNCTTNCYGNTCYTNCY